MSHPSSAASRRSVVRILPLSLGVATLGVGASLLAPTLLDPDRPDGWIRRRIADASGEGGAMRGLRTLADVAAAAGLPLRIPTRLAPLPEGGWIQQGQTVTEPRHGQPALLVVRETRVAADGLGLGLAGVTLAFPPPSPASAPSPPWAGGILAAERLTARADGAGLREVVMEDVQATGQRRILRIPRLTAGRLDADGVWEIEMASGTRVAPGVAGEEPIPGGRSPGGRWREIGTSLFA